MCPASDAAFPPNASSGGAANLRRLGRATAIAAAALAGTSGAPASARAAESASAAPESAAARGSRNATFSPNQTYAETALAQAGPLLTYGAAKTPVTQVRVFDVAPGGRRGPAITVSDKSRAARLGGTQVRNGATAVAFLQHLGGDRWEPRVAYRPAGAPKFLPAIAAGPVGSQSERPQSFVALGPDGTGVVYGYGLGPGYTLRRLHGDGTLGPVIVVAPRSIGRGSMRVAYGVSGDLVVAIRTLVEAPSLAAGDESSFTDVVYAATLPAGADRATPLEQLSGVATDPIKALRSIAHSLGAAIQAPGDDYLRRFQP